MSSWWKRFFGLDDGDHFDDSKPVSGVRNESGSRSPRGRFEDPGRRIEVKMINQYPMSRSRGREAENQRYKNETTHAMESSKRSSYQYDEPAYTRINRHKYDHKTNENRMSRNKIRDHQHNPYSSGYERKVSEELNSPKRVPFKPTTVASPVFGYRDRSEWIRTKSEAAPTSETVDQLDEVQTIDEEQNLHRPIPELDQKITENEIVEDTYNHLHFTETYEPAFPIDQSEDEEWEPEVIETETEREVNDSVNEMKTSSSVVRTTEDTHRKNPAVPYNVLMYGADRQALRQRQQHEELKHANQQTIKQRTSSIESTGSNKKALSIDLFQDPPLENSDNEAWIAEKREILTQVLKNFHVHADIVSYVQGPSVTRFEIRLHPGVKVSKVINLTEDIKLTMAAEQIRIAPVSGKNTVGIEIPNEKRKSVFLKQLLKSNQFKESTSPLTAALGMDISGRQVVTDLAKMPHGLIAGATGSGKSVCIHSLILSLIYKTDPESLRLVLIDPKVVELAAYQRLPHLAAPVITQPKDAALALRWAVDEMERRYQAFANVGVRDIKKYNQTVSQEEKWPYIVIIIDELADLMMASPQDVEESICRIAQKARAAGIHLLLATQRPSVDVITGLIKANIPTRIAFGVSAQADSRTILDAGGAERLLGQGDMLFAENGSRDIQRLQGAFVSDEEIDHVTESLMSWEAPPHLFDPTELREQRQGMADEDDELYEEAAYFVIDQGQASVSSLQRRFRIGYNRAARLIDSLEANEVISEANGSKPRQILMTKDYFDLSVSGAPVDNQ